MYGWVQKEEDMEAARVFSRRKYLEKWEDKQLTLLEKEIRDEEYLFEGQSAGQVAHALCFRPLCSWTCCRGGAGVGNGVLQAWR